MMKKIIQIMISLSLLLTPDFLQTPQRSRHSYGNVRAEHAAVRSKSKHASLIAQHQQSAGVSSDLVQTSDLNLCAVLPRILEMAVLARQSHHKRPRSMWHGD